MKNKLAIIIMAAGKGTRMNTELPKVLHKLNNKTLIEHVIDKTLKINPEKLLVVVGYKYELVKKQLNQPEITFPLKVQVCNSCFLVQVDEFAKHDEIFDKNYIYFSSYSSNEYSFNNQLSIVSTVV